MSAWGAYEADDQLGTLNLLMPERVKAAAELVTLGIIVSLT